ncbi:MAG: hypothetical protein MI743_02315 [Sneathiellales bacterium]|nr:hypothetical protein [Sneathiellales bacterium]
MEVRAVNFIECVMDAHSFVFENLGKVYLYALPILILVSASELIQAFFIRGIYQYFFLAIPFLLYSIYAVSWHRFAALGKNSGNLIAFYSFGVREIKYAILSAIALFTPLFALTLLGFRFQSTANQLAIILFIFLPISLFVLSALPSIALDQKFEPALFMKTGIKNVMTILIGVVFIFVLCLILMGAWWVVTWFIADISKNLVIHLILSISGHFVISPIILAFTTTCLSIFYVKAIGVDGLGTSIQVPINDGKVGNEIEKLGK